MTAPAEPGFVPVPAADAARYRELGLWEGRSLWDMLAEQAERHPHQLAVVDRSTRLTYSELLAQALRLAADLGTQGLGPGDAVLVQLPNSVALLVAYFALFRLGARPVTTQLAHRQFELGQLARRSRAVAHIVTHMPGDTDYTALAQDVAQNVAQNVAQDGAQEVATQRPLQIITLPLTLAPLPSNDPAAPQPQLPPAPSAHELALFQLSGGTTAIPKLIPRTHEDYLYSVRASVEACRFTSHTVYLAALPVTHNFPLSSPGALGTLLAGGRVVLLDRPHPQEILQAIQEECVTVTALVPALLPPLLRAAERLSPEPLASLALLQVGGAKLHAPLAKRIPQVLGCNLQQVFGMAEGLVCYTGLDESLERIASYQGHPMSTHDEVRVVDDHDQPVPQGVVGHLLTRGPYTIRGYYDAAEHNRTAFTSDGFYRTGDLVRLTDFGGLVVEGRHKDQVNRAGEKIAAAEVEALLCQHHTVEQAALVGVPDPYLGERSWAFIVSPQPPDPAVLLAHLRQQGLAAYKLPDRFQFLTSLPKTAIGKIDKRQLRSLAQNPNRAAQPLTESP